MSDCNVISIPVNSVDLKENIEEVVDGDVKLYIKKYGWIPSKPDHRDKLFFNAFPPKPIVVKSASLRSGMPKVYDQGQLGSCTGNAIAGAFEYDQMKQGLKDFMPSRLFIYYGERSIEGTIPLDNGASLRDGFIVINKSGVCSEVTCPYDIANFTNKPSVNAYTEALTHKSVKYMSIPATVTALKQAIVEGYPVIIGFSVPQSFESQSLATTGFMTIPTQKDKIIGGHAVVICGFNDNLTNNNTTGFFEVRNSWSPDWGLGGYFWLPYNNVNTLVSDCWVLETVQ